QKRQSPFGFFRVRRAIERDLESPIDLGVFVRACLLHNSFGEKARLLEDEIIVHQSQRLWGNGRNGAHRPGNNSRRAIKNLDQGKKDATFDKNIDAATPRGVIVLRVQRPAWA